MLLVQGGDANPKPPRTRKALEKLFEDLIVHGKNMGKVGKAKQASVPDVVKVKA